MDWVQRKKEVRIKQIRLLAEYIASGYFSNGQLDLGAVLKDEGIKLLFDHYEQSFDGLLVYDVNKFYIHLDLDKGNTRSSKRSRFSVAHELGHYFISEHHQSIVNGTFQVHPSKFKPQQTNIIEIEADSFAATLLMPSEPFKICCFRKKFSLDLIEAISNQFNISFTSALLRFADEDAGTYPLMISFFRNGVLSGYKKSNDFTFKNVPFKSKIGQPPPPSSVLGEHYRLKDSKFKDVQEIAADDWFWVNSSKKMKEQCFYSDYGYDISVLWIDY